MKASQILQEMCGKKKHKKADNPSCSVCLHYIDKENKCKLREKVIEKHGEENLEKWLKEPYKHNDCQYFESNDPNSDE